jgi:ADP-ribose pyrophosphatase YjhB (NUDIX family)
MTARRLRVAAYAVCLRDDMVLLARYVSPDRSQRHWTLPGGGIEHAEDPYDTVVREVAEETGYTVEVDRLLGVDSWTRMVKRGVRGGAELHTLAIFYSVHITGGELRYEVNGSTDLAAWVPVSDVVGLERVAIIDTGLKLHQTRPPGGHVEPVLLGGLLRL